MKVAFLAYLLLKQEKNYPMCMDEFTECQCKNWLAKFQTGNYDVEADKDTIKALIDAN